MSDEAPARSGRISIRHTLRRTDTKNVRHLLFFLGQASKPSNSGQEQVPIMTRHHELRYPFWGGSFTTPVFTFFGSCFQTNLHIDAPYCTYCFHVHDRISQKSEPEAVDIARETRLLAPKRSHDSHPLVSNQWQQYQTL